MALRTGKNLYFKTGIDNRGLKKGAAEGKGIIKNFAQQVSGTDVFAGVGISAGIAFGKAATHAKQFAQEYETAMKEVQTISDAVQQNYEGIKDQLVDMSKTVPDNATALAKAYYQIVSAGYDGAKGMELLETASKAAVGGVSDTLTAADGFTTVLNAWKLEAKDVTKVSDIMFQTVKLGKTTFSEIAGSISNVAALASASGISFKEISGSVATLTKQGVPTAMAFTQIRQAIIALSENLGDGWSKTMTFQEGLVALRDMAGGSDNKLKELVGRVEGMNAVLSMTGDNAKMAASDLEAMGNSFMASSDAYGVMAESAAIKFQTFRNTVSASLLPLGDFLKDNLADAATGFVNALETGKVEKYAKVLAVLAATMVTYKTAAAAATLSKIGWLRIVVKAKQAMLGLNSAMMANPIGLLAAGLAAATTALILFRRRSMEASKEVSEFYGNMNQEITTLDGLFSVAENAAEGTDARKKAIERINGKYGEYLENMLTEKSTLEDIKTAHEQAKSAAISRIADTAKAAAMDEAMAEAMNKQGEMQAKLYKKVSETLGGDAAQMAAENIGELGTKFSELYTEYAKLVAEGGTGRGPWKELQAEVRDFVDTFSNGDEYNLVWDIAESIHLDQTKLAAKKAEIEAFYAGFIQDVQEKVNENDDGDDPDGEAGDKDLAKLEEMLDKAHTAYEEWADYKQTSRADDLQAEYQHYLDIGGTYEEFLKTKLKLYKGNQKAISMIVKELAKIEVKEIEAAKEEAEKMDDFMDNLWIDMMEEFSDNVDDSIEENEKKQTAALKKYHNEIEAGLKGIEAVKMRYASNQEHLKAELQELKDHYKKARLPLDEEYYQLREKIMNKYKAREVEAWTDSAQEILGAFTKMFGDLDSETQEILEHVSGLLGNVGGAVAGFYSGDYVQMVTSVVGVFTELHGLIQSIGDAKDEKKIQARESAYKKLNEELTKTNVLLQEQLDLLADLDGEDWLQGVKAAFASLQAQMDDTLATLKEIDIKQNRGIVYSVDTSNWDAEDFRNYLLDNPDHMDADWMQELVDDYFSLESQFIDLIENVQAKLTGTTADAIGDSLARMFENGTIAAEDFAQSFEDLMKQAVVQSFKRQFIEAQMQDFYETFAGYMETGSRGGRGETAGVPGLSSLEMQRLRDEWEAIIANAQTGWDAMTGALGLDFGGDELGGPEGEAPTGIKGAIKGITEDTAGILAGQMGAIRINVARSVEIANQNLFLQSQIATNTYQLHAIRNLLENSNATIDERVNGR